MGGLTLTSTPETEGEPALLKADSSSSLFLSHKTLNDPPQSCELQQPPSIPHLAPAASLLSYITLGYTSLMFRAASNRCYRDWLNGTEMKTGCGENQHTAIVSQPWAPTAEIQAPCKRKTRKLILPLGIKTACFFPVKHPIPASSSSQLYHIAVSPCKAFPQFDSQKILGCRNLHVHQ